MHVCISMQFLYLKKLLLIILLHLVIKLHFSKMVSFNSGSGAFWKTQKFGWRISELEQYKIIPVDIRDKHHTPPHFYC